MRRGLRYSEVCDGSESIQEGKELELSSEKSRKVLTGKFMSLAAFFALGLAVGILGARLISHRYLAIHGDYISQVPPFSSVTQYVRHHPEFEAPPSADRTEPVWDALIPNGVGYVKHPTISPNVSVVSVFHELHCLYFIRRAYYANDTVGDFDVGIPRHPHAGHCFDYLRQSILCAASSQLEPTTERVNGNEHWGFKRQCRNYTEIKEWAEQWRAFDIEGSFVPFPLEHDH